MERNKSKQARRAEQWAKERKKMNWDVVWKVLASVFAFAGSMVAVYELVNYFRSDSQTFYFIILPGLAIITWFVILFQLFRKKNSYAILLSVITVLGGVVGSIGVHSYNKTQEDKVIVLVTQFDGPEETYGIHDQIMEDLLQATKGYKETVIIDGTETVTAGQGSEYARDLGKKAKADLVIWAWYRPTENPNITIHFENLSARQINILRESETYQPQVTLAQLESFEVQRQLGSETSTLISFVTGLSHYKAGNYQDALDRFNQIIDKKDISTYIDPVTLYLFIGYSHVEIGAYASSIEDYDKVIELDPNNANAYNNRGLSLSNLQDLDHAFQDFDKAIALDPNFATAYENRGGAYYFQKEYDLALQDVNKAIELDSDYAGTYSNRGLIFAEVKDYNRAIQDYDEAIRLDPNLGVAYYNRGIAYSDLKNYDLAIQDFDKAIELNPNSSAAYDNRGNVYSDLKNYERAIQDYDKAIKLNVNNATAFNNRGNAYAALKDYDHAISDYDVALELNTSYVDAYFNRGLLYSALSNYDDAIHDFDKVIDLSPTDASAYYNRGIAYRALSKITEAEADFKKYEELTGERP